MSSEAAGEAIKPETATAKQKPSAEQAKPQATEEKQANCLACNKPLKKLKRYYRNGKFYCNKRCWRKSIKPKSADDKT